MDFKLFHPFIKKVFNSKPACTASKCDIVQNVTSHCWDIKESGEEQKNQDLQTTDKIIPW